MPLLALLLGNAFSSVVGFFGAVMSKKLAVGAALTAFLIAGWVGIQTALLGLWTALAFVTPTEMLGPLAVIAYLLPSNMSPCVTAICTAKIGRWLWDRQREWAQSVAMA